MLADLKDSVRNDRTINMQDKYGASAVREGEGERERVGLWVCGWMDPSWCGWKVGKG